MLFSRELKKTATIRVRPWREAGQSLYFPFGHSRGGAGYILPEEQAKWLRYREWSPFNFVFVPLVLCLFLGGMLGGGQGVAMLAGAVIGAGLGWLFYQKQEKGFKKLTDSLAPAPVVLTEERYWQELAVQYSLFGLVSATLFTVLLVVALILSFFGNMGAVVGAPMLFGLHLAGTGLAVVQVKKVRNLLKGRWSGKKAAVVAGSLEGLQERG